MEKKHQAPDTIASALVQLRNNSEASSVMEFAKANKNVAQVASKLTADKLPAQHDSDGNRKITDPSIYSLRNISDAISQKDSDSETTLQLFPEIRNAADILISSVISPQDMFTEEANFTAIDGLTVQPVLPTLLPMVKEYFSTKINLMAKFEKILQSCLLFAGSHPSIVIPENSLDDLINGKLSMSRETLSEYLTPDGFRSVGYLGDPTKSPVPDSGQMFGLESYTTLAQPNRNITHRVALPSGLSKDNISAMEKALSFISVGDNPNALKLPKLKARRAMENMSFIRMKTMGERSSFDLAAESQKNKMSDRDLTQLLYTNSRLRQQPFIKAKTDDQLDRYSVGEALILDLPAESFIPVVQPGMPDDPIGGFILLDSDGHPVSRKAQKSHYDSMRRSFQAASNSYVGGQDLASSLLRQAKHNLGGSCETPTFDQAARIWSEIVEADLLARLRNGVFGKDVTISSLQSFYRMMLARAMSNQFTQVIFVPKDMMTYFTYKLNDDGTGKSLLEDTRILSAMRAQLLFAKVQGEVKNAIGRSRCIVQVPENDPNPQNTINMVIAEVLRQRSLTTPVSSINPQDVLNQVQNMSMEFEFEGATLPDVKINFEEVQTNYQPPSEDLEDTLRSRVIQGLLVPPELVDEASQAEFATIAISNHLLFAKKVREIQRKFTPQLSNHCRQILRSDSDFVISVKKVIMDNYELIMNREDVDEALVANKDSKKFIASLLVNEFISNISVELASPDVKSLENLLASLEKFETSLDKALDSVFSEDVTNSGLLGEEAFNRMAMMRSSIRGSLMRREMQRIGMASEVFDILAKTDNDSYVFDVATDVQAHSTAMVKILRSMMTKVQAIARAADAELPKLSVDAPSDAGGGSSYDTPSDTSGGGDSFDEFSDGGGGDSFDLPQEAEGENLDTPPGGDDLSDDISNI